MKAPQQVRAMGVGSVHDQRVKLSQQLEKVDTPILIVVDDIDRLERREIREILKLVRLTGNFPNVIYLLAFDLKRVESAIDDVSKSGENRSVSNYLDKIVQFVYEVPEIPPSFVAQQLELGLHEILTQVAPLKIDQNSRFPKVYWDLLAPIFASIRDVKRYLGSLKATVQSIKDRVDIRDLLTLEAVRILRPALFDALRRNRGGLSFTAQDLVPMGREALKERAGKSIESLKSSDNPEYVVSLVQHLFQFAHSLSGREPSDDLDSLLSARRVAHRDVLEFYLGRYEGRFLRASVIAREVIDRSSSKVGLTDYLHSIDRSEIGDVVRALVWEAKHLDNRQAIPFLSSLLDLAPIIPSGPRSIVEIRPEDAIFRVVFNALEAFDETDRPNVIRECLAETGSLEGKRILLDAVADDTPIDGALANAQLVDEILSSIAESFRERDAAHFSREPKLLWLITWLLDAGKLSPQDIPELLSHSPNAMLLLKNSARWNIGARSGEEAYISDLSALTLVLGSVEQVQRLIAICRGTEPDEQTTKLLDSLERQIDSASERAVLDESGKA